MSNYNAQIELNKIDTFKTVAVEPRVFGAFGTRQQAGFEFGKIVTKSLTLNADTPISEQIGIMATEIKAATFNLIEQVDTIETFEVASKESDRISQTVIGGLQAETAILNELRSQLDTIFLARINAVATSDTASSSAADLAATIAGVVRTMAATFAGSFTLFLAADLEAKIDLRNLDLLRTELANYNVSLVTTAKLSNITICIANNYVDVIGGYEPMAEGVIQNPIAHERVRHFRFAPSVIKTTKSGAVVATTYTVTTTAQAVGQPITA